MTDNRIRVEIFSAPSCNKCGKAFRLAETVLKEMGEESISLRLVNVIDEIDCAVDLGIRATPAIVINGVLVFTAIPSAEALREAITSQLSTEHQGAS